MSTESKIVPEPPKAVAVKVFGVGGTGLKVIDHLFRGGLPAAAFVAVNSGPPGSFDSPAAEQVSLETRLLRGLGTGGDPDRGRAAAEEHLSRLKALCQGVDAVFVVAGMGGGAGTGIAPVLARAAKEAGALVLGFVTLPFDCELSRRRKLAERGLAELKAAADGVVCLPNQKLFKLIDEKTTVLDTFQITNRLLAECVQGFWRLLTHNGLIEIHFDELCALLRDQHAESSFAVAEASGPARSREVVEKLLAHPMLEGGQVLAESEAVLVSLLGGPDLTMSEVNRVMEQLARQCEHAQVVMGAAIDPGFSERLAVTLIAARKNPETEQRLETPMVEEEGMGGQLLDRLPRPQPASRFAPSDPTLPADQAQQPLGRQGQVQPAPRPKKAPPRMRQGQLPLEIVSKGRFDKSEPNIHKGEDLDVPTYVRRGVALN
ncbi:Cell division protein FtsZ [Verrucomicrobia bacterium]|nr:Cell division protein FtsZ [Verrucomicrobiota bacterium]